MPDKSRDMHTKRRKQLLKNLFDVTRRLVNSDFCFLFKEGDP